MSVPVPGGESPSISPSPSNVSTTPSSGYVPSPSSGSNTSSPSNYTPSPIQSPSSSSTLSPSPTLTPSPSSDNSTTPVPSPSSSDGGTTDTGPSPSSSDGGTTNTGPSPSSSDGGTTDVGPSPSSSDGGTTDVGPSPSPSDSDYIAPSPSIIVTVPSPSSIEIATTASPQAINTSSQTPQTPILQDHPVFPIIALVLFGVCLFVITVFRKEIRKMTFRRDAYHTIDTPMSAEMANVHAALDEDDGASTDGYMFPEESEDEHIAEKQVPEIPVNSYENENVNDLI